MRRSLTTIVGFGMVTAIFMAIMSMFYLQQIPTKADLARLEDDIRREHGLYLSAAAPLAVALVRPAKEGDRSGLHIRVAMRPDLRNKKRTAELYLTRIAESVVSHPDWAGRIGFATVSEFRQGGGSVTRLPAPPETPEPPAGPGTKARAEPNAKGDQKSGAKPGIEAGAKPDAKSPR